MRGLFSPKNAIASYHPLIPRFEPTAWDFVWQAQCAAERERRAGLEFLCQTYRPPLLSLLLGWGYSQPDAEDLVQGFLLYFIRTNAVAKADPSKGRFRNYLVAVLKHYVAKQRARAAAAKRGGWLRLVALEALPQEVIKCDAGYLPERIPQCDREWADEIARRVLARLRREYAGSRGQRRLFAELQRFVWSGEIDYLKLERKLRRPVATLRCDLSRLRRRARECLREELAGGVAPGELHAECGYLLRVLCAAD